MKQLTKAPIERAMGAELTEHLDYEKHESGEQEQHGAGSISGTPLRHPRSSWSWLWARRPGSEPVPQPLRRRVVTSR